ncbi:glycosyltransferase family 4 protein [Clostridium sp. BNL1100]|uniref:glycosyltransferase family 4 protein n=1 Tax=Clostridium sp. BNL1100 TaxID=755731 RepID=UPI00024A774B|nr:glycosyltransferase family 4 protein [Clostridium sp. BNL1100]AEY67818.1 glycosyltransferase [Clostridium sp. BNL1100]
MKKVLMIAHQFPPIGGSGVQRTVKFVKYLRNFDYEPVILTRDALKAALKDETLLKDIPQGIKVIRTKACDFAALPGIFKYFGKVVNKLLVPDSERVWQHFARKQALAAIKDNKIDVIYTTSAPYSDHLLGVYLKKHYPEIPLVCDFRDEWTNNPYHVRKGLRAKTERNQEKMVLKYADCLITNTPVMLSNFLRDNPETKSKFYVIPNGYDDEDFDGMESIVPSNDKFTLTYTGLLYGKRKPDNFFEALKRAIDEGSVDKSKINVRLIGNYKVEQLQAVIDSYKLNGIVSLMPYMKHRECLLELIKSDALLLIEPSGPGAEAFYTGKVFEYMNTKRPILASIPEHGAAAQLITDTKTGLVSDFNDIETTKKNLIELYNCWTNGTNPVNPVIAEVKKFERKELTKALVEVLNNSFKK